MFLAIFGGMALLLAVFGISSVVAYSVVQRTREIGIRLALGAPRVRLLGHVLRRSAMLTGIGIVLGLAGAAGLARYLDSLLFELTPLDVTTFIAVVAVFLAVAALASYIPARRASRIQPVIALRTE